jgi:hypothetical protein
VICAAFDRIVHPASITAAICRWCQVALCCASESVGEAGAGDELSFRRVPCPPRLFLVIAFVCYA